MKNKQKCESCTVNASVIIDFADDDLVSQVVREVLAKDRVKIKTIKDLKIKRRLE
jgi:hypothetical protein